MNQRFGTEFKPADQLFFDQIREEAVVDTHIQQAAMVNSLENFKYVFDKALEGKALSLVALWLSVRIGDSFRKRRRNLEYQFPECLLSL